jgi:hypothetical protein
MSEILNQALLAQINRLKAINIEAIGESVSRLEKSAITSKENTDKLIQKVQNIDIPKEIKLTRHLTIGAKDRFFVAFIISTLFFLLIGSAGVIYGVKKDAKLENAERIINNQAIYIDWMRKEKGGEAIYQKYIKQK